MNNHPNRSRLPLPRITTEHAASVKIVVYREEYRAEGWEELPPLTLYAIPTAAYSLSRGRSRGPVAPTDEEIALGCQAEYRIKRGSPAQGDRIVTEVHIRR